MAGAVRLCKGRAAQAPPRRWVFTNLQDRGRAPAET
jgi:hypothetical protein